MSTLEERREARERTLEEEPDLRPSIGPRKPVQSVAGGKGNAPFSRAVAQKRPRLGPREDGYDG